MKISIVLTPAEIANLPQQNLDDVTAVVFDVLRATSTMTTALAHGVEAIYPAQDISEAHRLKEKYPHALLGGERHGEKIEGFDLGNSPLEYRDLAGREIISTTTNGTIALRAVAHAKVVIAGSLLNIQSVADFLARHPTPQLLLVCAGTGSAFALEDGLGLGALLEALGNPMLDDAGKMLLELWKSHRENVFSALADTKNGQNLLRRDRLAEVEWCSQLNQTTAVGILENEAMRRATN